MLAASSSEIDTPNSSSSASTRFIWCSESQVGIVSMLASGPITPGSTLSTRAITSRSFDSFTTGDLDPGSGLRREVRHGDRVVLRAAFVRRDRKAQAIEEVLHQRVLARRD